MADFPVCLKKKDGGFGVSGLRWCCFMPFIFSDIPGSRRTGNRAFICLTSDELGPLIMEIPHRRPTATRAAFQGRARCPSRKVTFFWEVDFFEFLFLLKNLGCGEERESRASALSLSLLHDDTAIRCEEQLIKH